MVFDGDSVVPAPSRKPDLISHTTSSLKPTPLNVTVAG